MSVWFLYKMKATIVLLLCILRYLLKCFFFHLRFWLYVYNIHLLLDSYNVRCFRFGVVYVRLKIHLFNSGFFCAYFIEITRILFNLNGYMYYVYAVGDDIFYIWTKILMEIFPSTNFSTAQRFQSIKFLIKHSFSHKMFYFSFFCVKCNAMEIISEPRNAF